MLVINEVLHNSHWNIASLRDHVATAGLKNAADADKLRRYVKQMSDVVWFGNDEFAVISGRSNSTGINNIPIFKDMLTEVKALSLQSSAQ